MDLKDLEALANRGTGLVPMRILRSFAPHKEGEIAGFTPAHALSHMKSSPPLAALLDAQVDAAIRAKIKDDPAKVPMVTKSSVPDGDAPKEPGKVEIADGWKEFHPVKRISLAKQIDPEFAAPDGVKPSEHADAVIEAELKRRQG